MTLQKIFHSMPKCLPVQEMQTETFTELMKLNFRKEIHRKNGKKIEEIFCQRTYGHL